jgi:HlyD family secretion protein
MQHPPPAVMAMAQGRSVRRHLLAGMLVCLMLVGGAGGWAATAHLAGAVIAPATLVVKSSLQKVQHPTGGVIGEIRVRNGDRVRSGQILLRLDETVTRANLAMVTKNLDELEGRRARLRAEQEGASTITFPEELMARAANEPGVRHILDGETGLFQARAATQEGQKSRLTERIGQLRQEIEGLEAQRDAKTREIELIREELKAVETLFAKKLVPLNRVITLQRQAARLEGERGHLVSAIAQARGKIAETDLQMMQIDRDFRAEVMKELRELDAKVGELGERKVTAEDQLRRIDIRSPQDGIVHDLSVHTVGGVIAPGDTLMAIVPEHDELVVEAKVAAGDIDQIAVGQPAMVRMTAFSQRTTPELAGEIVFVGADLTHDPQTNDSYYLVRVDLSGAELARLGDDVRLVPGMPAEVHIQTAPRTALSYLVKPLSDQIARAFREE